MARTKFPLVQHFVINKLVKPELKTKPLWQDLNIVPKYN